MIIHNHSDFAPPSAGMVILSVSTLDQKDDSSHSLVPEASTRCKVASSQGGRPRSVATRHDSRPQAPGRTGKVVAGGLPGDAGALIIIDQRPHRFYVSFGANLLSPPCRGRGSTKVQPPRPPEAPRLRRAAVTGTMQELASVLTHMARALQERDRDPLPISLDVAMEELELIAVSSERAAQALSLSGRDLGPYYPPTDL